MGVVRQAKEMTSPKVGEIPVSELLTLLTLLTLLLPAAWLFV